MVKMLHYANMIGARLGPGKWMMAKPCSHLCKLHLKLINQTRKWTIRHEDTSAICKHDKLQDWRDTMNVIHVQQKW